MNPENKFPLPPNMYRIKQIRKIPIIGTIACGLPILASENIERYTYLPDNISATFALQCKGDSMIDANIFDRDIVYIREQPAVENGEIAAVLINAEYETEATLKKVYWSDDKLMLVPANNAYEPIVFVKEEINTVRIIGKVVALLRDFE